MLFLACSVQAASASQGTILVPPVMGRTAVPVMEYTPVQNTVQDTSSACTDNVPDLPRVDLAKVRAAWLSWYNEAREKNGRGLLEYERNLDRTALEWSESAREKGTITHKRPGQKAYYDYRRMVSWFKERGLSFPSVNGSTFVENIGWDYYSCPDSTADCTEKLIASIRKTYNFFMSEKGKKYRAHYDSIMNGNYKKIGLGIAVDPVKKRYYLTVHYATDVVAVNETAKQVAACELPGNGKF